MDPWCILPQPPLSGLPCCWLIGIMGCCWNSFWKKKKNDVTASKWKTVLHRQVRPVFPQTQPFWGGTLDSACLIPQITEELFLTTCGWLSLSVSSQVLCMLCYAVSVWIYSGMFCDSIYRVVCSLYHTRMRICDVQACWAFWVHSFIRGLFE